MKINNELIIDIGFHTGEDTDFYLGKGFSVVAVEANPDLVLSGKTRFSEWLANGKLIIVEKAVTTDDNAKVAFYVNKEKNDWSSLDRESAEKGVTDVSEIIVETISLGTIFTEYGVPYYLKCDIENGDLEVSRQLALQPTKPEYASFEITDTGILDNLLMSGYTEFQLVNQNFNGWTQAPYPALEGEYYPKTFSGHSSGLFGKELPNERWVNGVQAGEILERFWSLREDYGSICFGWIDIHAKAPR